LFLLSHKELPIMSQWTESEDQQILKLYDRMLKLELSGKLGRGKDKTTKSQCIRDAQVKLQRSTGSIEAKLMNCSWCRLKTDQVIIEGYKPLKNCSNSLKVLHGLSLFD